MFQVASDMMSSHAEAGTRIEGKPNGVTDVVTMEICVIPDRFHREAESLSEEVESVAEELGAAKDIDR